MSENTTRSSVDESSDNEYKLVVSGSRSFTEDMTDEQAYNMCVRTIERLPVQPTEIVSGGLRGADEVGEQVARERNIDLKVSDLNWDELGCAAGPIQDQKMTKYADGVLAIWDSDSESLDTQRMINYGIDEVGVDHVWVIDHPNNRLECGRWIQPKSAVEDNPRLAVKPHQQQN